MDFDRVRKAFALIDEAQGLLGGGPTDYYLANIAAAYDLLINRYAPFRVGDKVVYIGRADRDPYNMRHGATGTVTSAECGVNGFRFGFMLDQETWTNDKGVENLICAEDRHTFVVADENLRLVRAV